MTNGREGSSGSGDGPDGKRRRPQPPILDLKPTAVTVEPPAERAESRPAEDDKQEVSDTTPPTADPPAFAAQESPPTADPVPEPVLADEPGPQAGSPEAAESGDSTVHKPEAPAQDQRRGIAGAALAAGAGAAAGALALMLVAWLLGIPIGRDVQVAQSADRIVALEDRVLELAARPPPAPDERIDALLKRMAAAEQGLARLTALETRLGAAEAALKQAGAAADGQATARVNALEGSVGTLTTAVADLRRRLDEIGAPPAGVTAMPPVDLESLTTRVAALEEAAKAVQAALARPAVPEPDQAARLAAAVMALRAAAESGAPYAAELAAVRGVAPGNPRLAALEPFAASGLPSLAALGTELAGLVPKAPPRAEPARQEGGWMERLQSTFSRLVRVRPADDAAPAAGVYAPVQAAVARGDIAAALAAAQGLPEAQRAPIEPWIKKAQARQAALTGVRELSRESLGALAAPKNEPARQ